MYKKIVFSIFITLSLFNCKNSETSPVLFCDMELLTENNQKIVGSLSKNTFFTDSIFSKGSSISNDFSYRGVNSIKADSLNPYVASLTLRNLTENNSFLITVMRYSSNRKGYIVAASDSGEFYVRQNVPIWQTIDDEWQKIEVEIKTPKNFTGNMKIYLWNPDKGIPVYFDNLTIKYLGNIRSKKIEQDTSIMIDKRDSNEYKIVKIGQQWWMAENLRFYIEDGATFYEKNNLNIKDYGMLYNWESANKSCPEGWHLPSDKEFIEMELLLGMGDNEKLLIGSRSVNVGTQLSSIGNSGFNLLYSGVCDRFGEFRQIGENTVLWTSTELNEEKAFSREFVKSLPNTCRFTDLKGYFFSVRCVKD
jgi:uncharacterized protein (TIGR02145 family)